MNLIIKDLKKSVNEMNNKLNAYQDQLGKLPVKKYEEVPNPFEDGDEDNFYYWIADDMEIAFGRWKDTKADKVRLAYGNCFKTLEEAQNFAKRLYVINVLKKYSSPFEVGEPNYCLALDTVSNKVTYLKEEVRQVNEIYFKSYKDMQEAFEVAGPKNVLKYYFGVEVKEEPISEEDLHLYYE